jgi:phage gpG-like protein
MGANADTTICPENEKVGQFDGNQAHSTGRYGLRIFHQMIPRKFPCKPIEKDWNVVLENAKIEDVSKHNDPYWKNPAITALFRDFTGWKCGRNAAIGERIGDVKWLNFKAADNARVNLEMSMTDYYGDGAALIDGALVIGKSNNIDPDGDMLLNVSPRGVEMPQREFMTVRNVRFYNYNWNTAAALGTCSHCV